MVREFVHLSRFRCAIPVDEGFLSVELVRRYVASHPSADVAPSLQLLDTRLTL